MVLVNNPPRETRHPQPVTCSRAPTARKLAAVRSLPSSSVYIEIRLSSGAPQSKRSLAIFMSNVSRGPSHPHVGNVGNIHTLGVMGSLWGGQVPLAECLPPPSPYEGEHVLGHLWQDILEDGRGAFFEVCLPSRVSRDHKPHTLSTLRAYFKHCNTVIL